MLTESENLRQTSACSALGTALACYLLSTLLVLLGVVAGTSLLKEPPYGSRQLVVLTGHKQLDAMTNWDGQWYLRIARDGYQYERQQQSSVAFFPVFPMLTEAIYHSTGVSPALAALLVSHVSLFAALWVLVMYLGARGRVGRDTKNKNELTSYVLAVCVLFPTTFFFRMAYSESLFLLAALLVMYGMSRKWPLIALAGLVGLATAVRPVGIALLAPLALELWSRYRLSWRAALHAAYVVPVSCWALLAYMLYLQIQFGQPLAFVQAQQQWQSRADVPPGEKLQALAILEPIWSVYQPSSPTSWKIWGQGLGPLFCLQFANPVYFVGAVLLIVFGAAKRWLSGREILLAAGLLLIPYLTRGYDMCMASQGRFCAVAFPIYIVLGQMLLRLPKAVAAVLLGISAFYLALYSALFAAGYYFV